MFSNTSFQFLWYSSRVIGPRLSSSSRNLAKSWSVFCFPKTCCPFTRRSTSGRRNTFVVRTTNRPLTGSPPRLISSSLIRTTTSRWGSFSRRIFSSTLSTEPSPAGTALFPSISNAYENEEEVLVMDFVIVSSRCSHETL